MDFKRNLTLLTDFYELTMMQGFLNEGIEDSLAVFDLFFRPMGETNYCICAGLEGAVKYIQNLRFEECDIEFLREKDIFSEEFLEKLRNFSFSGDIFAMPEGTVVFPHEPLLIVRARIFEAQLIESALLNIINFQTLIATKANRIVKAASPQTVAEFGLRRAHAPDASILGARSATIGGCGSTSNVLAAKLYGIPPKGTHAHSWIMAFDNELEAFRAYAKSFPDDCLLLVDTYNTLKSGVPNAITVFKELRDAGHKPVGIRLDSGDLAYLSKTARAMLDNEGFTECKIFASGDLDEYTIMSLKSQGAAIDIYGVGTCLITSSNNPALGGVYKLSAIERNGALEPILKISDNPIKVTNPGFKNVFRLYGRGDNKAVADLICLDDEEIDDSKDIIITHPTERWQKKTIKNFYAKPLLKKIMENGRLVCTLPTLSEITKNTINSLNEFWEEYTRLTMPQIYKVDLSDKLYELKQELLRKISKSNGK